MKANRLIGAALAMGLGLAVMSSATGVDAQSRRGKKAAPAPATAAQPPTTKRPIALVPSGIVWGMNHKQVAAVIDKQLNEIYRPIYKKTSPGVNMRALDAQLAEEKNAFRRSRINFGTLPTGIDATPLRGEYTYLNKESMLTHTRDGVKRYFFFIQDRLWKVIDERTLGEGSALGADYQAAVTKLAATVGVTGRVLAADFDKGRMSTEVDWKDAATHLRAIERGETAIALAYEDLATLGNLGSLRANKKTDDSGIDPDVADVVRKDEPAAPPPDAKKKK